MIIQYIREARCKDCKYCGYYYPLKKNGEESNLRRHKCKRTGMPVSLSKKVCKDWELGCGIPANYDRIVLKEQHEDIKRML